MRVLAARASLWLAPGLLAVAGCGTTWSVADVDGDGYTVADGDCWDAVEGPPGTGLTGADLSPDAVEVWFDGIDQDCGGDDDWDPDGDGFVQDEAYLGRGTLGVPGAGDHRGAGDCWEGPRGVVDIAHDALNGEAQLRPEDVNPDALEDTPYDGIDQNCDGSSDFDADGDGYESAAKQQRDGSTGDDCDDAEADVNPGVELELCNDIDDDCDGLLDGEDDDVDPASVRTWFRDADADGFGDPAVTEQSCSTLDGYVEDESTDCDDDDPDVNPGATEVCNDTDDDCDLLVDDADDSVDACVGGTEAWADADGDGYGDPFSGAYSCDVPADRVDNVLDCDDADASINPDAQEVCDGADNDCDGLLDDDDDSIDLGTTTTYFSDSDGDGYGAPGTGVESCRPPTDTVLDNTDCDDTDASVNPGETEVVGDGKDGDCDGSESCYRDADDDGYRPDATSTVASADGDCSDAGEATASDPTGDCDESDAAIHPGATEIDADGVDSDCDGTEVCYVDADGDGYADSSGATVTSTDGDCADAGEATSAAPRTDCDDAEPLANPGEDERCNDGIDNDCDASTTCELTDGSLAAAPLKLTGPAAGDGIGYALSFLGDVNGDGIDDFAVGAPLFDSVGGNSGAAYVLYGSTSAYDPHTTAVESITAGSRVLLGGQTGEQAGRGVAGGDVDGDGNVDVLVGSPQYGPQAGQTYLLAGPVTGTAAVSLLSDTDVRGGDIGHAGWALAANGDTDGDGKADVLVGSPESSATGGTDLGPGGVTLVLGADVAAGSYGAATGIDWTGTSTGDSAGLAVAWIDLDGDGLDDLVAGAPLATPAGAGNQAGAVYVVAGPATAGGLFSGEAVFAGGAARDWNGWSVAGGADVDGDGYVDLLSGSPLEGTAGGNAGAVHVVRGGASVLATTSLSAWLTLHAEAANDRLGQSVAGAGDVDADGHDDLVAGAWKEASVGNNAGALYLVHGPLTGGTLDLGTSSAVVKLTGEAAGDVAGWSVAAGGDVNGDGFDDVTVGAPLNDTSAANAGAVYLLLGLGG